MNRMVNRLMLVLFIAPSIGLAMDDAVSSASSTVQNITAQVKAATFEGKLNSAVALTKSAVTNLDTATVVQLIKNHPGKAALITATAGFVGYKGYQAAQSARKRWHNLRTVDKFLVVCGTSGAALLGVFVADEAGVIDVGSWANRMSHAFDKKMHEARIFVSPATVTVMKLLKSGEQVYSNVRENLACKLSNGLSGDGKGV